jgi:N-acetyl-gamma-glutamyl-phosphate reductase
LAESNESDHPLMQKNSVQTAIAGVSGYAGMELARLLLHHPSLKGIPPVFVGRDAEPFRLTDLHPQLAGNGTASLMVEPFSWDLLEKRGVNLLFLATPHEQSRSWVPEALARGLKVIDLSGAWRLHADEHRAVYAFHDQDPALAKQIQSHSVYGLPELHRESIRTAQLIANPGCYATSIILGLKPLVASGWVDLDHGIICDSKSGVSGAGKAPTPTTHFMYAADNFSAYAVFGHRHMGEMLEQLNLKESQITFTPHLLPIPRGILSTLYVTFREKKEAEEVEACFLEFYASSPMVRVLSTLPQIQYSVHTNYCDIGFKLAKDGRRCIVVSCLDNLLKGAAGQAAENMNLLCGFDEAEGLA